jgi:biofilm PGA synthesis protein PgaA
LGAPHLATGITPREILSNRERGQGLRDELAFEFRWARDEPSSEKVRAARLDAVILKMHAAQQDPGTDPEVRDGLRGDLVEALSERGRSREAVDGYQSMVSDGVVIQPYVTSAAVQAYEALKQPDEAVALYQALPPEPEPSYGVKASYFYALLESERYDAALSWADLIVGKEPIYEYASFPELRTENADYGRALVLAALARSYTDRPAEGQARLEAILDLAPADTDARLALAETYELRGWPRTAAATSDLLIAEDPESVSPLPQLFSDQLDDADWRGAYQTLTWMGTLLPPDDAQLLHAERDWDTHEMAEVIIDGQLGRSYGGGPAGVVDSEIGEYVYSSPIDWDYRAYLHLDQTEGQPVQGTTFRHAVGAGLEYHTTDWLATGELLEIDGSGPFPQFSVEATPDDYWKFGASYAVRTLDIPIAAVVVGVHADRLGLNLDYRVSESRDFGAEAVHEQFSDSNSRSELSGYWRERWITGPVYKLDTRVDVGTSENTLDDTNYFNPKRDLSATLTFENQWLQFRHYTTSLTHEVDVGFGDYYQQGYGQGSIALLRYQLVYEVNDRLTVRVGLGTTIRPFDGQREHLDVLSFYLDGRF